MSLLGLQTRVFDIFHFFGKFGITRFYNGDPPLSRINYTYISNTKILATYSQLCYEVIPQFDRFLKIEFILHVILVKNFIVESN